jgi:hypothetical protein
MGPRAGLNDVGKRKFLTLQGRELRPVGRPASRQSLYRLRYPGSPRAHVYIEIFLLPPGCPVTFPPELFQLSNSVTIIIIIIILISGTWVPHKMGISWSSVRLLISQRLCSVNVINHRRLIKLNNCNFNTGNDSQHPCPYLTHGQISNTKFAPREVALHVYECESGIIQSKWETRK